MGNFIERLHKGPLVADGATGTNLQAAGFAATMHTEEWILDHPDRILGLEREFVDAGADIILTCTFGATSVRMQGSKYESRVRELNYRAAVLAREAIGRDPGVLVAGSMGPLGKLLKPLGAITPEQAIASYSEQAQGLHQGGVDLLVIETQFSIEEARTAVEAVRTVSDLPTVVSFSYDRGTRTMMGVKPVGAADTFASLGVSMIGVNCGTTLENALIVLQEYARTTPTLPAWAKPNAGVPRMEDTRPVYDVTPQQMGDFALVAVQTGAKVVGGCCGSTPAHIRAIATALKSRTDRA